jgi:hypothetical protein
MCGVFGRVGGGERECQPCVSSLLTSRRGSRLRCWRYTGVATRTHTPWRAFPTEGAALTGPTRLRLDALAYADPDEQPTWQGLEPKPPRHPPGFALVRTARALARLPRLAHLQFTHEDRDGPTSLGRSVLACGSPSLAAELALCPALRLLEIDRRLDPLWRHERDAAHGGPRRAPLPSPEWAAFVHALRAGGCRAALRPAAPASAVDTCSFSTDFDVDS